MSNPPADSADTAASLVIVLSSGSAEAASLALRYAATAAAMDVGVELHAVSSGAAACLAAAHITPALLSQAQQAHEMGARLYVCPLALAELGWGAQALIAEVSGVRGAASLLGAGLAPGARFMSF
jgi:predicted peroxiredoxin